MNSLTTNKLRSTSLNLEMIGKESLLSLNNAEAVSAKIRSEGSINLNKLTAESVEIDCLKY